MWEFIKENNKVRKQENKKTRKQELDQESNLEIMVVCLVEFLFSCFLDRFLGRVLVFFLSSFFLDRFLGRVLVFSFSFLLVFFYKFPSQAERKKTTRRRWRRTNSLHRKIKKTAKNQKSEEVKDYDILSGV